MSESVINLDALRAAREEVEGMSTAPKVTFNGKTYELAKSLPFGAFMRMAALRAAMQRGEGDAAEAMSGMYALLKALFAERTDEFLDSGPSMEDITGMLEALGPAYGLGNGDAVGEASDSLTSASDSTTPSKQTSSETTESI